MHLHTYLQLGMTSCLQNKNPDSETQIPFGQRLGSNLVGGTEENTEAGGGHAGSPVSHCPYSKLQLGRSLGIFEPSSESTTILSNIVIVMLGVVLETISWDNSQNIEIRLKFIFVDFLNLQCPSNSFNRFSS